MRTKALVIPNPPILRLPSANRREKETDSVRQRCHFRKEVTKRLSGNPGRNSTMYQNHLKHFSC